MESPQGKNSAQIDRDRSECDSEAKTSSNYSRSAEAQTWLWGIFVAAPVFIVSAAVDVATFGTTPVMEATPDVLGALPGPSRGNPGFETYFSAYRACMEARDYVTR